MAEQRLIEAEALKYSIIKRLVDSRNSKKHGKIKQLFDSKASEKHGALEIVGECIDNAPTIEAKPVVHAHWVSKDTMEKFPYAKNHYCSNCKVDVIECGNFCTNCGAQMDEKENDNG